MLLRDRCWHLKGTASHQMECTVCEEDYCGHFFKPHFQQLPPQLAIIHPVQIKENQINIL